MKWRLRRAVAADAAALSLVASASFLEAFAGLLDGADIVAHCAAKSAPGVFRDWIGDAASIVAIAEAEAGAAPIGFSVLTTPDLPVATSSPDIELKRIYALSATHGSGLGPAMMAMALTDAASLGKTRMLLGVYGGNLRARRFYEKQGFKVVGERRFLVGATWHDDLIFARSI